MSFVEALHKAHQNAVSCGMQIAITMSCRDEWQAQASSGLEGLMVAPPPSSWISVTRMNVRADQYGPGSAGQVSRGRATAYLREQIPDSRVGGNRTGILYREGTLVDPAKFGPHAPNWAIRKVLWWFQQVVPAPNCRLAEWKALRSARFRAARGRSERQFVNAAQQAGRDCDRWREPSPDLGGVAGPNSGHHACL